MVGSCVEIQKAFGENGILNMVKMSDPHRPAHGCGIDRLGI